MKTFKIIFILFFLTLPAIAQEVLRVCSYDVSGYSYDNDNDRARKFGRIIKQIEPDIIVVQNISDEMSSANLGYSLTNILKVSFAHTVLFSNTSISFKSSKIGGYSRTEYATKGEPIVQYQLNSMVGKDTFEFFTVHFKAGNSAEEKSIRLEQAEKLSQIILTSKKRKLVTGTFNFSGSDDPAYLALLKSSVIDPVAKWNNNSAQYCYLYTQSTRGFNDTACGGASGSGLNKRQDFIFHTLNLQGNLNPVYLYVFGNDGINRMNASITEPKNTIVADSIAEMLSCVSDHLPVYADYVISKTTSIDEEKFDNSPFKETSGEIIINVPGLHSISIINAAGIEIMKKVNTDGYISISKSEFPSGVYFLKTHLNSLFQESTPAMYKFAVY